MGKPAREAFLALSPVERTIVATVTRPTTRFALAAALLARHGAIEGDVDAADRALAQTMRDTLEQWNVAADHGYQFRSTLRLPPNVASEIRELAADALAVPRARGSNRVESGVASCVLAFVLTPGLLLQRGARLTISGGLHGSDATKLASVLPGVDAYARWWVRRRAIERDESGAPVFRVANATNALSQLSGLALLEALTDGWIDPPELALVAVALAADEGDVLDLGAAMHAAGIDPHRLGAPFRVLSVGPMDNTLSLPRDLHRMLSGRGSSTDAVQKSFVQPNFEILLSTSASLEDVLVIACCAELQHLDAVARLRLTKNAIQRARANGIGVEALHAALERASGRALPTNVTTALAEWGEGVGRGDLREAIVLSLSGTTSQLDRAARVLEGIVLRRPEPGLFLLARVPKAKQLEQLRAIGLFVKNEIEPRRARDLERLSFASSPEDEDDEPEPRHHELPRSDVRFVEEPPRAIDLRRMFAERRVDRLLQRSVPQAKPSPIPLGVTGEIDDSDERLDVAFGLCLRRFSHRRDWLIDLERIQDLDECLFLEEHDPTTLALAYEQAISPANLRLAIVAATQLLKQRR